MAAAPPPAALPAASSSAASAAAVAGAAASALTASTLRRKRLSDITNLASDGRAKALAVAGKENGAVLVSVAVKDAYIAQLLKENNALLRALSERNRVVEMTVSEVQNLRAAMQTLTQQNQQLAQANSQMLVERTNDKDRLKVFQHGMGCNQGVLKSKELVIKEQRKLIRELKAMKGRQHYMLGQSESDHVDAPIPANQLACISNRKRPLRSQSLGPAVVNRQVAANDKDAGSRKSLRRRSIRSKHDLYELHEDECEAEDESIPLLTLARDDPMNDDSKNQVKSSRSISNALTYKVKEEVEEIEPIGIQYPPERRSSIGRPLRRAAEKVSSYKETPLNIKMRRPESASLGDNRGEQVSMEHF